MHLVHPVPTNRLLGVDCHWWPAAHFHQILLLLLAVTCVGFKSPLAAWSHSFTSEGRAEAKSLNPARTRWLEQYGHPLPSFLMATVVIHLWLCLAHFQCLRAEPLTKTRSGVFAPFAL